MDDVYWDELTADVLAERYGVSAEVVERVPMGTDTLNWRVLTTDGHRLLVKEYVLTADLDAARSAWDTSEKPYLNRSWNVWFEQASHRGDLLVVRA